MSRNSIYVAVGLAGLGLAFGVISFLVWVTRGRPGLIRHKLRIGAAIVTFAGIMTGMAAGCDIAPKCYAAALPDSRTNVGPYEVSLDGARNGVVVIDREVTCRLSGTITYGWGTVFSFRLVGERGRVVQKGEIEARDGAFDERVEAFDIFVGTFVEPQRYSLRFYSVPSGEQETRPDAMIAQFLLYLY